MCGCGANVSANVANSVAPAYRVQSATVRESGPCDYTIENIDSWLEKVNCFKDKGLYVGTHVTTKQLNIYIGVLLSAKNYKDNICYFRTELSEIEGFITFVINTGQC